MRLLLECTEDSSQASLVRAIYIGSRLGLWISETGEENLRWFLDSVLPVAYPVSVIDKLWSYTLYDLFNHLGDYQGTGMESLVSELLRRCSLESARSVLWRLFDPHELSWARIEFFRRRLLVNSPRAMQLLLEKTGGVEFLRAPGGHRRRPQSFLSHAMESYPQWYDLVETINQSTFEVSEVIRGDLDLYQCGWTEEGS